MPSRSFAYAGIFALGVLALGACGSRTGLFGVDALGNTLDGSFPSGPDAGPDGPVACTPGTFGLDVATAQLMFVVDRSGSMAFSLDGTVPDGSGNLPPGIVSRWDTLRDALFQTITPFDSQLAMGAKFFPEVPPDVPRPTAQDECQTDTGVGITPARGNVKDIINVFDTTVPSGGTPTSEAVRIAAQYLAGARTVARTMVLATDGGPNCNGDLDQTNCVCTAVNNNTCNRPEGQYNCLDDARSISTVRDTFEKLGIPVYVIGIGSTERPAFLQVLDDMAVAGGRPRPTAPRHYNVQTAAEMKTALTTISDSIAKCTYLTPSAPIDPNAITVEINGVLIPRDPSHTNGWDWVDKAFGTIAFFGPACVTASSSGTTPTSVSGVVSCNNP